MTTPLDRPLKRELAIDGKTYTLRVSPDGLKLTEKGRRKGVEFSWASIVSGDAALAVALRASLPGAHGAAPAEPAGPTDRGSKRRSAAGARGARRRRG